MRSRRPTALVLAALAVTASVALAGCLASDPPSRAVRPADVGYDPTSIEVTDVRVESTTITSWDGRTQLAVVAYIPETGDKLPDGSTPRFPLTVFLHGWGADKESYTGQSSLPDPVAQQAPADPSADVDRLAQFARAGIVAVAYDARGFGDSSGQATVAGPAEAADLDHVIAWAEGTYATNGKVGLVGRSYGAGQALNAMVRNGAIDAVVAHYGWADLAHALIPGNVPKLAWGNVVLGEGLVGSQARLDPIVYSWYGEATTRGDLERVKADMDARSSFAALGADDTPLLLCQGLEETLFPQQDAIANRAGGFTRSYYYTGGHGSSDPGCWARSQAWLQFFLGGFDTQVDAWPLLDAVDANGRDRIEYATWPHIEPTTYRLRNDELSTGPPSEATFTIDQRVLANPLGEPDVLFDQAGLPRPFLPAGATQDPAALVFETEPVVGTPTLLGATRLVLHPVEGVQYPFQVAGSLYRVSGSSAQLLGRAAVAALDPSDLESGGTVTMTFPWTHAKLAPGDQVRLKLAANDPTTWYPLAAIYSVTFDGHSELAIPLRMD